MEAEGKQICDSEVTSEFTTEHDKNVEAEEGGSGSCEDYDGEGEEDEEDEDAFRFKSGVNPLDFVGDDASGVQTYQQFERLEYEALAEKKRKALADCRREGPAKKARYDEVSEEAMDKLMDLMNYGNRRRRRKPKKRGRRKGSRNKLSPEIAGMLGEATLHYAHGRYKEAISVLNEVIRRAPNLPDSYHTLGLVHKALGNHKTAFDFYMLAGLLKPKDSSLWKLLFTWSVEQGNVGQTCYCLSKAITADPEDINLRFYQASISVELGEYQKAAEAFEQIQKISPENVEALKNAAKLYLKCGQREHGVRILEDYFVCHKSRVDLTVIDLLVSIFMEHGEYERALQKMEDVQMIYYRVTGLPFELKVKAGICHVHLGDMEKAEICFSILPKERTQQHADLVNRVAESFISAGRLNSGLKYYHMLETDDRANNGALHLKIAQCYLNLQDRELAVKYFYKALHSLEDHIEARLNLASLLLEDAKDEEAISLLSPPKSLDSESNNVSSTRPKPWWLDGRIKFKLCHIYKAKGMLEDFIRTILPSVFESLYIESLGRKVKVKKRLTESVLSERIKKLDDQQADGIFCGSRPIATPSERLKASRARKLLQKKVALKEEKKAAALAAGLDWRSEDENAESQEEPAKEPPLPNIVVDEEHHCLIIDLCKALASTQRYYEALKIIRLTLKCGNNTLPVEKKEQLRSLGAQMAYRTMDHKDGFDCARDIVLEHPHSIASWNCYYKVSSRLGRNYSKHLKFLRTMRAKHKDCVAPILITGHQFTSVSHHQDAAREYLEAYKLLPDNPLTNLCAGTSLINLALGFRLQNKHQCVAQGLSFLFNNLRLCESSQEALYNIARAFHHVGLVHLAAFYYEKVLALREKDYPIPKLPNEDWDVAENQKHGYCDLRREAAFNLHLIYKTSGAVDLARQVLRDHCTFD